MITLSLMVTCCSPAPSSESLANTDIEQIQAASDISEEINCRADTPNAIGQSIADTYEVSYEKVMGWFCDGYSFDNIMISLETSEATDIPAETLLVMLLEKDWEDIWDEIGFTGTP
jgi:hypothetical protein